MMLIKVCHCKSCSSSGAANIAGRIGTELKNSKDPNAAFIIPDIKMTACDKAGVTINAGTKQYDCITADNFGNFWSEISAQL